MAQEIKFTKYRDRGAYHWGWYEENTYGYRGYADLSIGYFPEAGSLLDIGCGDGLMAYLFFKRGFDVTGIDNDSTGIRLGNARIAEEVFKTEPKRPWYRRLPGWEKRILEASGIRLLRKSIFDYEPGRTFDYALCLEVIEHVPQPGLLIEQTIRLVNRYAVFSTPNALHNDPHDLDYFNWGPDAFIRFLGPDRAELLHVDDARIFARLDCRYKE